MIDSLTSPACFAMEFTCSGSFEPNIVENSTASTLCSKRSVKKKQNTKNCAMKL